MGKTWLVFDVYAMAYRAFFSSGHLSYGGDPTGTLYGVLRDVVHLQEKYATHHCAFCFDYGQGLREQEFPTYKAKRKLKTPPEGVGPMKKQIDLLRSKYLEELGYPNVLYQDGYEADDIIASVCNNLEFDDEAIIISGDEDLFQLLSNRVRLYFQKSKTLWTKQRFMREYGIHPDQWANVKTIGGCVTDEVKGIEGVGEKTAIKWLLGHKTNKDHLIADFLGTKQHAANRKMVTLPYPGTDEFILADHDAPSKQSWRKLMKRLGIDSLADFDPSSVTRNLFASK